ncbi:hypothetical protein KR026_006966 [Drosophila bipectinata]|nr:hypothetical protein KR026_006966 [Drosophila bipectinata]
MFTARLLPRLQLHRPILARIRCLPRSAVVTGEGKPSSTTNTGLSPVSGGSLVHRRLFGSQVDEESSLDSATYERVCSETLDALCDYFEELTENAQDLPGSDVAYGVRRGAHREPGPEARHLRDQPADAQQADLAQLPHQRSQALRLRGQPSGGQVGLQAQWTVAARSAAAGDTFHIEGPVGQLPPPALLQLVARSLV